jgi:predicted ATPase
MQLRIDNIGPIGSAVIDLAGLTVIGGPNNTGKSTIGKTLFAIVQAIRNREEEYANSQGNEVNKLVSELVSELRTIRGSNISPIAFRQFTSGLRNIEQFMGDDSATNIDNALNEARSKILSQLFYRIERPADPDIEFEKHPRNISRQESIVDDALEKIRKVLSAKMNARELYFASFKQMTSTVLAKEINNKRSSASGKIDLLENDQHILASIFNDDSLDSLDIKEDIMFSLFNEATLIESPFVLNYTDGSAGRQLSSTGQVIYSGPSSPTASDLLAKLNFAVKEAVPRNPLEEAIAGTIDKTINGRLYYDADEREFVFSSNDDINVSIANTASGVKTLGIIQMLASAGFLNSANLLIIDEPEVHLHPAWQIVFAEIIAQLVSNNVYCLVSSHSPYFIQAIEAYSSIYKLQDATKFYVSRRQEEDGRCYFDDITTNVEPLYKLLADPMKDIAFLKSQSRASSNEQPGKHANK